MVRQIVFLIVALVLAAFPCLAQAQPNQTPENRPAGTDSTSTCSFTFTSGAGATLLKFCVTANGNIVQLETPTGHEHIAVGLTSEGYGICNETPATAYWDYADDGESGNWGAASVVSQTASSVKIARTTEDGIWTLPQTFVLDPKTPSVKIVMALKNNTLAPRVAYLVRWADIDPDGEVHAAFGATRNAAAAWKASTWGFGLTLQNSRTSQFGR